MDREENLRGEADYQVSCSTVSEIEDRVFLELSDAPA